ncbi:hypothetical protein AcW2_000512 [Taiwanofungus camphoratus]|nr:hypothetical protein AcW2_000512 [Antrodia cinnamomea]
MSDQEQTYASDYVMCGTVTHFIDSRHGVTPAPMSATPIPKVNGGSSEQHRMLESDVAFLQSILNQNDVDDDQLDVAELLRRLETADGIATGVEGRLDDIMGTLDNLLNALESGDKHVSYGEEFTLVRTGDDTVVEEDQARVAVSEDAVVDQTGDTKN